MNSSITLVAVLSLLLTPTTKTDNTTLAVEQVLSSRIVEVTDFINKIDDVPNLYTVKPGDNLSKIGADHQITWQRLWAKNTNLNHPDTINVGDVLTIPEPSEQLEREIPASVLLPAKTPGVASPGNFDGINGYDYGYCTWYVKNKRGSSLPNGLGNANTWYSRASTMGMSTGIEPRVGAIGTTTRGALGHVVYVESLNGDGTINISEMNYRGWNIESTRTVPASDFVYIY